MFAKCSNLGNGPGRFLTRSLATITLSVFAAGHQNFVKLPEDVFHLHMYTLSVRTSRSIENSSSWRLGHALVFPHPLHVDPSTRQMRTGEGDWCQSALDPSVSRSHLIAHVPGDGSHLQVFQGVTLLRIRQDDSA